MWKWGLGLEERLHRTLEPGRDVVPTILLSGGKSRGLVRSDRTWETDALKGPEAQVEQASKMWERVRAMVQATIEIEIHHKRDPSHADCDGRWKDTQDRDTTGTA
ncbi:hypothetical protein ARMGADRAFT_1034030 [Armillaria gallica]|uniref:Uncharacterized protein n=1 Tax=Armillaria gallica TaxID=47427 RepID=A0A2H3DBW1_ARMGA|nr:hypothetical protein ARMGADRAFT_1034030 [Armillaria gallica]